jgi:hypothetical protein
MNNSTIKLNPKQFSKGRTNNNVLQFLLQEQVFDEPVFTHFRAGNKKVVKRKRLPLYQLLTLSQLEREFVEDTLPLLKKQSLLNISSTLFNIIRDRLVKLNLETHAETLQEYFYTFMWVLSRLPKVQDWTDIQSILDYITRIHYNKPIFKLLFEWALDVKVCDAQSLDWSVLQKIVSGYGAMKNHPVVIKFMKMMGLAFAGGIFAFFNKEIEMLHIWEMLSGAMIDIGEKSDFIVALIDLFQYIGERILAFWTTGKWNSLFYTPTHFSKWAEQATDILDKSVALANLSAIGEDYHNYIGSLSKLIVDGEEIKRYIKAGEHKDIVSQTLSRLKTLKNQILIKNACGKTREAPFALLLATGSGQGKSSLIETIITHYSKLYNKNLDDEYIYTRTANEAHWNNFNPQQWACILDDIASVNPNTASEDPSMVDILQTINNVPFSTPQAAIEDKGKSPFMCELVIATTNTKDLKAHCWFNNPQAVRRRLPYIVDAIPKEEYRKEGGYQLDQYKVPITQDGYYLDLWDLTVEEVTVDSNQKITLKKILETDSIYTFIKFLNSVIAAHKSAQAAFMASREASRSAILCNMCQIPNVVCGCPILDIQGAQVSDIAVGALCSYGTYKTMEFTTESISRALAVNPELIDRPAHLIAAATYVSSQRISHGISTSPYNPVNICKKKLREAVLCGIDTIYEVISPKVKTFACILAVVGGLGLTWKFLTKECPEILELSPQGNIFEVGVTPESPGEPENVWRKDDYVPSEFIDKLSESWSSLPLTKIASLVGKNVVWCKTSHGVEGKNHTIFRALCIGGHLYVTTNHCLPKDDYFTLQVIQENPVEGCNGNVIFKVAQNRLFRCPKEELVFFEINHMPVRRDLRKLIPLYGSRINGPGVMITRQADGSNEYSHSVRSTLVTDKFVDQFNMNMDLIVSQFENDTKVGMCGSPVVVQMPHGTVLCGVHVLGGQDKMGVCVYLHKEILSSAETFFSVPIIDSVSPDLHDYQLNKLINQKCVARFIDKGSVEVYGSLTGFKAEPKSSAIRTKMNPYLVSKGWKNDYGPAPLKGYMPLRHALLPMVKKDFIFKEDVLHKCAEHFLNEILSGLPSDQKVELQNPYSLKVAVNGMPGLKYVDSMNFSTSAGFPYNKSKTNYITRLPSDDVWQHPVKLDEVITNDVQKIWDRMTSCQRSGIVFMQHLKDEVLPLRKVEAKKARVFMGGPFGWSVAVRMALLPFIRIMQKNKYLFECAPGMNATSIEWTRLHHYLASFGDRAIAGDFKFFDKNMGALVILQAFWIIYELHKRCGASQDHLNAIWSIAEDVAFAFCNFNGDLMQFFGSNPSGHPLTVIINCLVNSLYMRYCFSELSPKGDSASFREVVRLITYGDDNAMTSKVDWFNHTAIADVLANVGIEYTMADKEAESKPFISLSEISFLKRTFVWSDILNAYCAVLDENSIKKSLLMCVPSKTICHEQQCVDIVRSAISEYFFYGREKFDEMTLFLKNMLNDCGLTPYIEHNTFETWDNLVVRFEKASHDYLEWEPETTKQILGEFHWNLPN